MRSTELARRRASRARTPVLFAGAAVAVAVVAGLAMVVGRDTGTTITATTAYGHRTALPVLDVPDGELVATRAVAHDGLTVLAAATVTGAGEWIVVFPSVGPPIPIHTPSGAWHEHTDAPIQGVRGPGTVWTGTQLIVWGGSPDGDRTIGDVPRA